MPSTSDEVRDTWKDGFGRIWTTLDCGHRRNEGHFRDQVENGDKDYPEDFCHKGCHEGSDESADKEGQGDAPSRVVRDGKKTRTPLVPRSRGKKQ